MSSIQRSSSEDTFIAPNTDDSIGNQISSLVSQLEARRQNLQQQQSRVQEHLPTSDASVNSPGEQSSNIDSTQPVHLQPSQQQLQQQLQLQLQHLQSQVQEVQKLQQQHYKQQNQQHVQADISNAAHHCRDSTIASGQKLNGKFSRNMNDEGNSSSGSTTSGEAP